MTVYFLQSILKLFDGKKRLSALFVILHLNFM